MLSNYFQSNYRYHISQLGQEKIILTIAATGSENHAPPSHVNIQLRISEFPEGISSSLRDFIVLVFNIEIFQIKFSRK